MCGRSHRSHSLGRHRVSLCYHSTEIPRCHLRRHKGRDTAAALTAGSSWRHLDGGIKGQQPPQGRGALRSTIRKNQGHCSSCCRAQGGKDEVFSLHTTTHTLLWEAEVPLCCVTSPSLLPHGQVMHSSWHNKAKQDEKGKRDVKRTPCLRNQKGNTLTANMMMEI